MKLLNHKQTVHLAFGVLQSTTAKVKMAGRDWVKVHKQPKKKGPYPDILTKQTW